MNVEIDAWRAGIGSFLDGFFIESCGGVDDLVVLGDWALEFPVPAADCCFHYDRLEN
jgi:hypothetical protein